MKPFYQIFLIIVCSSTFMTSISYSHSLEKTVIVSPYNFKETLTKLEESIKSNRLFVVNRANAQRGALSLGVAIPGNQVWGIFAPQFAVQLLRLSAEAGFEAPIRVYIVENDDRSIEISYIKPSLLFQPYQLPELDLLAQELDTLFQNIMLAIQ